MKKRPGGSCKVGRPQLRTAGVAGWGVIKAPFARQLLSLRTCAALAEPSQLRRISGEIRVNRRGKFFALNKTFSQALVVETYPLCRRIKFWHSATENVSAQQYADQGWEGTPLLHGGGESASAVGESGAAAGVVPGRNQRQSASGMAQNAGGV